jgi:hypothetical protein
MTKLTEELTEEEKKSLIIINKFLFDIYARANPEDGSIELDTHVNSKLLNTLDNLYHLFPDLLK